MKQKINEFLAEHDSYNTAYTCRLNERIVEFCNGSICEEDCKIHADPITRDYCNEISLSTNLAMAKKLWFLVDVNPDYIKAEIGNIWGSVDNLTVLTLDFKSVAAAEAYARALCLYKCLGGEE